MPVQLALHHAQLNEEQLVEAEPLTGTIKLGLIIGVMDLRQGFAERQQSLAFECRRGQVIRHLGGHQIHQELDRLAGVPFQQPLRQRMHRHQPPRMHQICVGRVRLPGRFRKLTHAVVQRDFPAQRNHAPKGKLPSEPGLVKVDRSDRAGVIADRHLNAGRRAIKDAHIAHFANDRAGRADDQPSDAALRRKIIVAMGKMVEQILNCA